MSSYITKTILDRMPSDIKMVYIEKADEYDDPWVFKLVSGTGKNREWGDFARGYQYSNEGLASFINEAILEYPDNSILFGDGMGNTWDKSEIVASLGEKTMRGYKTSPKKKTTKKCPIKVDFRRML